MPAESVAGGRENRGGGCGGVKDDGRERRSYRPGVPPRGRSRGERGVALLVVLAAIALLTISVMDFTYAGQVGYRRTAHWLKARQAQMLADSGVRLAATLLSIDSRVKSAIATIGETQGRDTTATTALTDFWAGICSRESEPACPQNPLSFVCELDIGDGMLAVRIEDEGGRFNINSLNEFQDCEGSVGQWHHDMLGNLLLGGGVDPALRGAIVDWIDRDERPYRCGAPGAEAAEYAARDFAYGPRNRPISGLRELALIDGIDAAQLSRLRRGATALPLPEERDQRRSAGSININTASDATLAALAASGEGGLQPFLTRIRNERCVAPFTEADIDSRLGAILGDNGRAAALAKRLAVSSNWFRVRATGRLDDVEQSAEALLQRTDGSVVFASYLPRRGPNIAGLNWDAVLPVATMAGLSLSEGGGF